MVWVLLIATRNPDPAAHSPPLQPLPLALATDPLSWSPVEAVRIATDDAEPPMWKVAAIEVGRRVLGCTSREPSAYRCPKQRWGTLSVGGRRTRVRPTPTYPASPFREH